MTISAQIIADSISPAGIRLTTMQLRYPRFIHSEFMTHRVFSRNASSSRAIPVAKMIEDLRRDPAMPVYWGANQKGMQAAEELSDEAIVSCKQNWLTSMENAIHSAELMISNGLHKQIANRLLEPWAHINVVVTTTKWDNFYSLRRHKDAQPEIKVLADKMFEAQYISQPNPLSVGEWHLPYINLRDFDEATQRHRYMEDNDLRLKMGYQDLIAVSVARCARVSYLTHDGRATTLEEDIKLYERLVGSVPLHASPAEHQATPDVQQKDLITKISDWKHPEEHGNFTGWRQFRKQLESSFSGS